VHLDVDLAWPLPALNRGPVQLRFGAAYSPRPWAQLLAGVSSEESAGRGPQLGCGASLRHDELELSLSAMQRPHGEHTSVRAALAWHFMPPTPPKAVRQVHRAFKPEPEPTPEPETGSFELQAGYREGQLHVAWPAAPQGAAYELLMGLVPGATMKIVTEEPLKVRSWSGNPGMLGMTYYFRVRVLGADGTELGRSRLRSIQVPAGVTP
jgi:hypothetical protein